MFMKIRLWEVRWLFPEVTELTVIDTVYCSHLDSILTHVHSNFPTEAKDRYYYYSTLWIRSPKLGKAKELPGDHTVTRDRTGTGAQDCPRAQKLTFIEIWKTFIKTNNRHLFGEGLYKEHLRPQYPLRSRESMEWVHKLFSCGSQAHERSYNRMWGHKELGHRENFWTHNNHTSTQY